MFAFIWLLCISTVVCFKYFDELQTSRGKIVVFIYIYMHIQLGWILWLLFKELFMTVWIHVKHWSQSLWMRFLRWNITFLYLMGIFPPYKAPASTPPGFFSAILLFYLLFLLPLLDMFRKWMQSIMWHRKLCLQWE